MKNRIESLISSTMKLAEDPGCTGILFGVVLACVLALTLLPTQVANTIVLVYTLAGLLSIWLLTPILAPQKLHWRLLAGLVAGLFCPPLVFIRIITMLSDLILSIVFYLFDYMKEKGKNS